MHYPPEFATIFPKSFFAQLDSFFTASFAGPVFIDLTTLARSLAEEKEKSAVTSWLSESENKLFSSFKFQKRYVEWLGGRLCAKKAMTDYIQKFNSLQIIPHPSEMITLSQENGRPYFIHDHPTLKNSLPDLSISHGGRYGMAMVSETLCGIDIQEKRPSLEKVKEKYCLQAEENILMSTLQTTFFHSPHHLTLLWAAKEALKKMLSGLKLIGFLDMVLEDIEIISDTIFLFKIQLPYQFQHMNQMTIITSYHESFGVALCQLPKESVQLLNNGSRGNA